MGINFAQEVAVHGDALQLRTERTRILASNIANENTPGYQAQDMDFAATMAAATATAGGALAPAGAQDTLYRVPFHPSGDGNTVEIGVEQAAFAQNASDYQTSLTFLSMQIKGIAKAINGQ
ncbi:flagellar basal body rod protein FlgB [Rugamonas sp.]|uniref:flagellar basal body rod protein FlgB n=1 Tax=Rugamonas sp. TaxID=1926287 RepID=UPI0025DC8B76|nr:flagellar basal body rod protein FlgB [Rugamonas sp.]